MEDFLALVAPAVRALGVELVVTTEVRGEGDDIEYRVTINGETIEIYRGLESFEQPDESFPWYAASVRPLARVNELLAGAGVKERFHLLYPGSNDGVALLIDPAIPDALRAAGLTDPNEMPLLAE